MASETINMSIIDVSEVVSVYLLFEPETNLVSDDLQDVANDIGSTAESYGKQIEDVTVGTVDTERSRLIEGQVIFSTKEINTMVLGSIISDVKSMYGVGDVLESTVTSNINETKKNIRRRYDFIE